MGVALVRVRAGLQGDLPRLRSDEGHRRGLVQTGALQMEVVDAGFVLHLDGVGTGLERLHSLARLLQLDGEAGTDLTGEAGALLCARVTHRNRGQRDGEDGEREQKAS